MEKLTKIGIIGTQCVGKTTLVDDMLLQWPQLSRPEKSYRDLIKEKNLPINKNGTKEAQSQILDVLIDQAMHNYGKGKKIVFDRTPLDNLVYSLWLYDKGLGGVDEKFIDDCVVMVRNALKFYSVIFYIPLCQENDVTVENKELRSTDLIYRAEIANIFHGIFRAWEKGGSRFFDHSDCPAIIPIYGQPMERIAMISMYINEKCEFPGEDESLVGDFLKDSLPEINK